MDQIFDSSPGDYHRRPKVLSWDNDLWSNRPTRLELLPAAETASKYSALAPNTSRNFRREECKVSKAQMMTHLENLTDSWTE